MAQAVTDLRALPPGPYYARAHVSSGTTAVGDMRRRFTVIEAPAADAASTVAGASATRPALAAPRPGSTGLLPFALDQALGPQVLGGFLDRVAARGDAASPAMRDLLDRARTATLRDIAITDDQAAAAPVAAFVKGLSLLAQNRLEPAANAFRTAMRASADFYPAMIYLGVCYAAGGNDKEAAGAWRTALIRESDSAPLHLLLTDALLRQGRADLALQTVEGARAKWPDDPALKRRYAVAAMLAGQEAAGLSAVDGLVAAKIDDEPSLAIALRLLYEGLASNKPYVTADADRERLLRLADVYRERGGPAVALIDTWINAVARKQ
jgi:tetratricopeptide (TPR) repeat protein